MKATTTLADILKDIDSGKTPTFEPVDKDEILQFKTNPLASVILHTELASDLTNGYDYSEVFNDPDDIELGYNSSLLKGDLCGMPEFSDSCEWADEIISYYQDMISIKKIKGLDLVPFEEKIKEVLELLKKNQTRVSFLPILVKLPRFYESQKKFYTITKGLKSFEDIEEKAGTFFTWKGKVTPLHIFSKFTKKEQKQITYYHFVTQDSNLIEYSGTKDHFLEALFKNPQFLEMEFEMEIDFNPIEHPVYGFMYGRATNINILC